jgi:hypothetical protein
MLCVVNVQKVWTTPCSKQKSALSCAKGPNADVWLYLNLACIDYAYVQASRSCFLLPCVYLLLLDAQPTPPGRADFGLSSSLTARPRNVLACTWGGRLEERVCCVLLRCVPACRGETRRCDACQSAPKVARRSCAEISPVYIYYTRELTFDPGRIPLSAATAREADDRFSAATTATGKLQPAGGPEHGIEGCLLSIQHDDVRVHAFCTELGNVRSGICSVRTPESRTSELPPRKFG